MVYSHSLCTLDTSENSNKKYKLSRQIVIPDILPIYIYIYIYKLYIYIYPQGSLVEITNQRFSLKYQTFRQLAAAFISGSGLQSVHVLTSGISK